MTLDFQAVETGDLAMTATVTGEGVDATAAVAVGNATIVGTGYAVRLPVVVRP